MNRFVYLSDVVSLQLESDRCTGCGMCAIVCPHGVIVLEDGRAVISDRDACMECGACSLNCPVDAIDVNAGVGCAQAVINTTLGRTGGDCCCVIDQEVNEEGDCAKPSKSGSGCC